MPSVSSDSEVGTSLSSGVSPVGTLSAEEAGWVENVARPSLRKGEVLRKLLHISPGALPFLLHSIPHDDPLNPLALWCVTGLTVILTGVFLAFYPIVRRPGETGLLVTCLAYPATFLATMHLFPAHLEFACVVVVVLALGDGAAHIAGRSLGGRPLPWNTGKTWTGLLAFMVFAAPAAALAYWVEARPVVSPWTAIACGSAAAVAGAIAESARSRITDNLRIGIAAAAATIAVTYWMLPDQG